MKPGKEKRIEVSEEIRKTIKDNPTVQSWLNLYVNNWTRIQMESRLGIFLMWYNQPLAKLLNLTVSEEVELLVKFQREMKEKGLGNNSILSILSSPRALFSHMGKSAKLKRSQTINWEKGRGYQFSNGDLSALWQVSDLRMKCYLSLATSTGFSIKDILEIDRQKLESLIDKAKAEGSKFAYLETTRKKTGAEMLLVLNPLAKKWVSTWLASYKEDTILGCGEDTINLELKRLSEKAKLSTHGLKVSSHAIRHWVYISLLKGGLSYPAVKLHVGQTIPKLAEIYAELYKEITEKYENTPLYDKYLNFLGEEPDKKYINEVEELKRSIEQMKTNYNLMFEEIHREYKESMEGLRKDFEIALEAERNKMKVEFQNALERRVQELLKMANKTP
jgi:site-specific recombinase XerD